MATLTIPLSRIEGHARVQIHFHDSRVLAVHFQATELRGFEYFVQGAPPEQMPVIVPRICGVCSTAHHLAAVKALEDLYEVEPPPQAIRIRELMMLGQLIQNQATSLFLLTMPDFPGQTGRPSLFHLEDSRELAPKVLEIRRAGTELIALAGGQFIHPIKAIIGGVTSAISRTSADAFRQRLRAVLPLAERMFEIYWSLFLQLRDRIDTLGDDAPTYYLAAVSRGHAYYGGPLRILNPDGEEVPSFSVCDYDRHFCEVEMEGSYSDGTLFGGEIMRTNSLARLNLLGRMGTPLADGYVMRFQETWGRPAHAILLFNLARGIELVYCLERSLELLAQNLEHGEFRVGYTPRDGRGCGIIEAPRGPLIHDYRVRDGKIARAKFVIPTQHNMLAIERALKVAAQRYISNQGIDLELERAVGRVVRAFDPCIACATH